MRIANHGGRAVIVIPAGTGDATSDPTGDMVVDISELSGGAIGPDMRSVYDNWDDVLALAANVKPFGSDPERRVFDETQLGCPVPEPRQVFAIGLNYRTHAEESGMTLPAVPATFTKFPASLSGPFDDIEIVGEAVDWEVELVAIIGKRADQVAEADGWSFVAGLTIGQDISDRALQFAAGAQFSLGKSRRGYGPLGPVVVSVDEFADRDDLALGCSVNGETMQDARTNDLVFDVPRLVAELSAVLPLLPGDVIFTGTPSGVGMARKPPRSLHAGDVLETWIEGIGTIRNRCV